MPPITTPGDGFTVVRDEHRAQRREVGGLVEGGGECGGLVRGRGRGALGKRETRGEQQQRGGEKRTTFHAGEDRAPVRSGESRVWEGWITRGHLKVTSYSQSNRRC